jgi:hypothetical protein
MPRHPKNFSLPKGHLEALSYETEAFLSKINAVFTVQE